MEPWGFVTVDGMRRVLQGGWRVQALAESVVCGKNVRSCLSVAVAERCKGRLGGGVQAAVKRSCMLSENDERDCD